jgi:hypothetical protein
MKSGKRLLKSAPAMLAVAILFAVTAWPAAARATCQLGKGVQHVVYVEFDNVHFTRDNPNVPSDLEQMPHLLNFITQNGTLDSGDHAVLISHTANDILTTQTGLYSDDDGIAVANSFGVFDPAGVAFPSSFFYWTDLVKDINPATMDSTFALTTPGGDNVPAPWVPFTRAGCDVGAYSTANIVLERSPFDVAKVFGNPSSQLSEPEPQRTNDFIGEAIHCTQGSALCSTANGGVSDQLPSEPDGYTGYQALFGAKYIYPVLGNPNDYNGNPLNSFPGFDPVPAQTLAVVEAMLKKHIPVVFAYIADAHDNQEGSALSPEGTFGPGEAPYVKQLKDYDSAFATFFANLKSEGIDQSNTLFVFTPDEGDHFVGAAPTNPGCDGVTTPCTYPTSPVPGVGELDINLNGLTAAAGDSTPFSIHTDDAPTVYVHGQPSPTDPSARKLEQTMAGLTAKNLHTGSTENLMAAMADPVEETMLHMVTQADPARTPTFTFFGDPNFFFLSGGSTTPSVGTGFAWNHGDIQPEIARTFVAIAGPGVNNLGVTDSFFSDHVDVRPTIMWLTGLTDDYAHDGRVLLELIEPNALSSDLHAHRETLLRLGQAYKEINAPFGQLAMSTLAISTHALQSTSTNDSTYTQLEAQIAAWTAQRDNIASQMQAMLEGAEFSGQAIDEQQAKSLISQAQSLIDQASSLAASL